MTTLHLLSAPMDSTSFKQCLAQLENGYQLGADDALSPDGASNAAGTLVLLGDAVYGLNIVRQRLPEITIKAIADDFNSRNVQSILQLAAEQINTLLISYAALVELSCQHHNSKSWS